MLERVLRGLLLLLLLVCCQPSSRAPGSRGGDLVPSAWHKVRALVLSQAPGLRSNEWDLKPSAWNKVKDKFQVSRQTKFLGALHVIWCVAKTSTRVVVRSDVRLVT